jgi:rifampicin phosphotransferase
MSINTRCVLLAAALLEGCVATPTRLATGADGRLSGDYTDRVASEAEWRALAAAPARGTVGRMEVVKTVIDLQQGRRLYFIESHRWDLHFVFLQKFVDAMQDGRMFTDREYTDPDRRFILGSVIHYRDGDLWSFELDFCDTLEEPRAIEAFRQVRAAMWNGAALRYHPVPPAHAAAIDRLRRDIPVITTDEIFGATRYQALQLGDAWGTLRIVAGEVHAGEVGAHDILVLAQPPLDLPSCSAIVTSELQTPLSHVAILAANRGTPNMALRGAHLDPEFRKRDGQLVHLHVGPQDFTLRSATREEAERDWLFEIHHPERRPLRSDRDVGLPPLAQLGTKRADTVGAKAAGLGELSRVLPPAALPRAFAVPFHAYARHLASSGADRELAALLADGAFRADPAVRERRLGELRRRIEAAPVDPALCAAIRARIAAGFPGARVRFRSSTNAEDLAGFNGAGLYQSVVTGPSPDEAAIADALRAVWASAWSFPGFEERRRFGIVQSEVAMGILVQESIDAPAGIGVAITANPFAQGLSGMLINVTTGDGSVTSPAPGEIPEQVLLHTWPSLVVERLSSSSRAGGKPVLTDAEVLALGKLLGDIHSHFFHGELGFLEEAMDVEFLITRERRIVILQARPYPIHWSEGRQLRSY